MTSSATPPDALRRFARKCRHDASTGCVNWIGGTTTGRGGTARYGAFHFEGKRWAAHRWAAKYIHGLEVEGCQISPTCDNPLCQQHLVSAPITDENGFKHNWVLISVGARTLPELQEPDAEALPFYLTPAWLKPFETKETEPDAAPF